MRGERAAFVSTSPWAGHGASVGSRGKPDSQWGPRRKSWSASRAAPLGSAPGPAGLGEAEGGGAGGPPPQQGEPAGLRQPVRRPFSANVAATSSPLNSHSFLETSPISLIAETCSSSATSTDTSQSHYFCPARRGLCPQTASLCPCPLEDLCFSL